MPRRKKPPYDDTLRFRAFKALSARIYRIIELRGHGDPTDFMREGTTKLVEAEEKRLGLPPMTPAMVAEIEAQYGKKSEPIEQMPAQRRKVVYPKDKRGRVAPPHDRD